MCCRANHVRLLIYPVTDNCLTFLTLVKKYVVGWRYAGSGHGTRPCTATPTTHSLRSGTLPFRSSVDQIGANIACQQIAWVYRGPVVARTAPRAPSLAVALLLSHGAAHDHGCHSARVGMRPSSAPKLYRSGRVLCHAVGGATVGQLLALRWHSAHVADDVRQQ